MKVLGFQFGEWVEQQILKNLNNPARHYPEEDEPAEPPSGLDPRSPFGERAEKSFDVPTEEVRTLSTAFEQAPGPSVDAQGRPRTTITPAMRRSLSRSPPRGMSEEAVGGAAPVMPGSEAEPLQEVPVPDSALSARSHTNPYEC